MAVVCGEYVDLPLDLAWKTIFEGAVVQGEEYAPFISKRFSDITRWRITADFGTGVAVQHEWETNEMTQSGNVYQYESFYAIVSSDYFNFRSGEGSNYYKLEVQ